MAVGAILEQNFGSGLQPIAFASRKLNATEIRYSAYEREMLGIVWALGQWKHYFQGPYPIIIQTDHAPLRHLPNQTSVNSRVWRWLSILQGYNVEIRHIPGKKNPADSLSRQLISDALVRKESVKDANAEYVTRLRVAENATDEQIQSALHQLFNQSVQSPQGQIKNQDNQDPQGHSILTELPQGEIQSVHDDSGPQGTNSSILAPTAISKIQLDNSLKNSLHTALQSESPYSEILQDLSGGTRQIIKNNLIFKRMNRILVVHDQSQDTELDFWRIVVPEDPSK